jgi:hypothetical protein
MGLSSSVTPLGGAASSPLRLPVESRLPLDKPPAVFLGKGTRVLDGAGCSTVVNGMGVTGVPGSAVPFVGVSSGAESSGVPGTSSELRFRVFLRVSVGDEVLTGKRVWLRSRR